MTAGLKKLHHINRYLQQAEAEVVPSSSLVEVEVEVGVKVEVGVGVEIEVGVWAKMQFSFLTFSVRWVGGGGWVGGWVGGEMENKANLSLSLVEVEAELGNKQTNIAETFLKQP